MLVMASQAFSQRLYFIYLQAEADQPFFVRINERVHSSNSTGWLLLSRLKDSSYQFSVGFPANKWPEQKFSLSIKAKDHGFTLKNFGDKGWGLVDLQTASIIMAEKTNTGNSVINVQPGIVSPFTEILARAADDPSLRFRTVANKVEENKLAAQPAVVKEELKPETPIVTQATKETQAAPSIIPPVIEKTAEVDTASAGKDRIKSIERLVVTQENPPVAKNEEVIAPNTEVSKVTTEELKAKVDSSVTSSTGVKPEAANTSVARIEPPPTEKIPEKAPESVEKPLPPVREDVKPETAVEYKRSVVTRRSESSTSEGFGLTFIDDHLDGKRDTIKIIIPNPKRGFVPVGTQTKEDPRFLDISPPDTSKQAGVKSVNMEGTKPPAVAEVKKCATAAAESDFLKLRRKMADENGDDDMIDQAKKAFKVKCYATVQIKYLSALFLNDYGKFKFFQAAQPFVTDPENFHALSAELKEEYYITRFKSIQP
jgi:hypothetical protein